MLTEVERTEGPLLLRRCDACYGERACALRSHRCAIRGHQAHLTLLRPILADSSEWMGGVDGGCQLLRVGHGARDAGAYRSPGRRPPNA